MKILIADDESLVRQSKEDRGDIAVGVSKGKKIGCLISSHQILFLF